MPVTVLWAQLKKDGHYLISVVLGSGWYPNRRYKWEDTKRLMDYGIKIITKRNPLKPGNSF